MMRPFYAVVPSLALVLAGVPGGNLSSFESSFEEGLVSAGRSSTEAEPATSPRPYLDLEGYDEEDDDEGKEAPALAASVTIEATVFRHIEEETAWRSRTFRVDGLPGRDLVLLWIEAPRRVSAHRFEVAVEMTAVQLLPSDFPAVGRVGLPSRLVPRSPEQAIRDRARVRGPGSFQVTFEVVELAEGVFQVVGARVTGRPGELRGE